MQYVFVRGGAPARPHERNNSGYNKLLHNYFLSLLRAIGLGATNYLLSGLTAQHESLGDVERGVDCRIEGRVARILRHRGKSRCIVWKKIDHHSGGRAGCARMPGRETRV